MESALDHYDARALLEWQVELGVTEAILDAPLDRYDAPAKVEKPQPAAAAPALASQSEIDPVAAARDAAGRATDLDSLKAAMTAFGHCDLKRGARNLVFGDGNPAARVMIIGEAPGRDEDREGRPFVGREGHLLDRMLAAIDMGREHNLSAQSVYLTNLLPWRAPQSRDPQAGEIAMMLPFLRRHVEIIAPDVIVLMGNTACSAILGKGSITRVRGQWSTALDKPVLPMFHPAYLLQKPFAKREAWADLLSLKAKSKDL